MGYFNEMAENLRNRPVYDFSFIYNNVMIHNDANYGTAYVSRHNKYHFRTNCCMIKTSTFYDQFNLKSLDNYNGATIDSFNKCEKCGYEIAPDLLHDYKSIRYYHNHKKILCDECVDDLNGHTWIR